MSRYIPTFQRLAQVLLRLSIHAFVDFNADMLIQCSPTPASDVARNDVELLSSVETHRVGSVGLDFQESPRASMRFRDVETGVGRGNGTMM